MLRQASSRNQRAKGFRLKHALQLGILVAICIWLLYQVKHSHEKKRAYDARHSKLITKDIENQEDFFSFGRKDLTRTNEAGSVKEIHSEEENEEIQEEEEPEVKQEETEDDEARGAGDDEIGQQDQIITDEEMEHVDDSTEEEEKEGQMEETDVLDSQDNEGGTQAREENYKRDDVSSAVVHDTHATESETVTVNTKSTDEEQVVDGSEGENDSANDGSKVDVAVDNMEKQETEPETNYAVNGTVDDPRDGNVTVSGSLNNPSDVKDNGIIPDNNLAKNMTDADTKEAEAETSIPKDALVSNSTIVEDKVQTDTLINATAVTESNNQTELSADSTVSVSMNQTGVATAGTESNNQTELSANSTVSVSMNQTEVDELHLEVQMSNGTVGLDSSQDQNTTVDNGTGGGVKPNLENVVGQDERSNSTATSEATDDRSRAVVKEDIETRIDLATLPDIENEEKIMDKEAAAA